MSAFYLTLPCDRARFFADGVPANPTPDVRTRPAFDVTGKPCYLTMLERTVFCHFCHEPILPGVWHRWLPATLCYQPFCLACAPVEFPPVTFWWP